MPRYARRVDDNLKEVVAAFRQLGCSVNVENGVVDLKVGYGGLTCLVEVKDGAKPPSARKLTPAQVEFRKTWTGGIYLVQDLYDVHNCVITLRNWSWAISIAAKDAPTA